MRDYTKQEIESIKRGYSALEAGINVNWSSQPRIRAALKYERTTAKRPVIVAKALLCQAFVQGWDKPHTPIYEVAYYSAGYIDLMLMAADLAILGREKISEDDLALIRAGSDAHIAMMEGKAA